MLEFVYNAVQLQFIESGSGSGLLVHPDPESDTDSHFLEPEIKQMYSSKPYLDFFLSK